MSIQKLSVPEDRSLADGEGLEPPYGSPRRLSRPMQLPFCHPSVSGRPVPSSCITGLVTCRQCFSHRSRQGLTPCRSDTKNFSVCLIWDSRNPPNPRRSSRPLMNPPTPSGPVFCVLTSPILPGLFRACRADSCSAHRIATAFMPPKPASSERGVAATCRSSPGCSPSPFVVKTIYSQKNNLSSIISYKK